MQYISVWIKVFFRWCNIMFKCSRPKVFCKKGALRNFTKFTGKNLCQMLFFNKVAGQACNFIKKEPLAHVFSCEFCEISKNNFLHRTLLVAASVCFISLVLADEKGLTLTTSFLFG